MNMGMLLSATVIPKMCIVKRKNNMCHYHVFISASRADCPCNSPRTKLLRHTLDAMGLPSVKATGVYQGKQEDSFLVPCVGYDEVVALCGVAKSFQQDCILVVMSTFNVVTPANSEHHVLYAFLQSADDWHRCYTSGTLKATIEPPATDHTCIGGVYYTLK